MNPTNFCMSCLHSFSNSCALVIASVWFCSVSSILSKRKHILEMESLSCWIVLDSSLVVVSELVSCDLKVMDSHVCLLDPSEIQVPVLEASEKELTDCAAYCSNGSSLLTNTMVVLNHTLMTKPLGIASIMSLFRLLCILVKWSFNHFVVD